LLVLMLQRQGGLHYQTPHFFYFLFVNMVPTFPGLPVGGTGYARL
jgi:hypothetical protein